MTRKIAGRWRDGVLQERLINYGPGRAVIGHGKHMNPIAVQAGGKTFVNVQGGHGHMQRGSKSPPPVR